MTTQASLKGFANKLSKAKALRREPIALRLSGTGGGEFFLDCSKGDVQLAKGWPADTPVLELIGDAQRIAAVLAGRKNATKQFLAGGFRIRGDLRYASDIALELGIIEQPL